jgi:hypothetical protein
MNWRWLWRASIWARRPPSARRVKLVVGLIAALIAMALIERYIGWPDWAQMERPPRRPKY